MDKTKEVCDNEYLEGLQPKPFAASSLFSVNMRQKLNEPMRFLGSLLVVPPFPSIRVTLAAAFAEILKKSLAGEDVIVARGDSALDYVSSVFLRDV